MQKPFTSSVPAFPASPPPCGCANARLAGRRPRRRRSRPAAAAAPISTPPPTSPSTTAIICCCRATASALSYARSIGTEAGLVGAGARAVSVRRLSRTGQRWQLDLGDVRLPLWVFDEARRVPDTGLRDYLALAPLAWGRHRSAGRQHHSLQGHAVRCAVVQPLLLAALQRRSAGELGRACRRHRARNAARGRARPAVR